MRCVLNACVLFLFPPQATASALSFVFVLFFFFCFLFFEYHSISRSTSDTTSTRGDTHNTTRIHNSTIVRYSLSRMRCPLASCERSHLPLAVHFRICCRCRRRRSFVLFLSFLFFCAVCVPSPVPCSPLHLSVAMASQQTFAAMEAALMDFTKPLDVALLDQAVQAFFIDGNQQVQ